MIWDLVSRKVFYIEQRAHSRIPMIRFSLLDPTAHLRRKDSVRTASICRRSERWLTMRITLCYLSTGEEEVSEDQDGFCE
jgi:hypothetical protein